MASVADHGPATHLGRIAVEVAAGVAERRRAVRRRAGWPRPGSAQHAGLQAGEALGDRQRHELRRADRQLVQLEGVEDRLDARVVAVGVVVGGADAEVAEPADELGDVRADELEHRLALLQRAGAVLEGRAGDALEARQLARGLDEVVVGAGLADERARGRRSSAWRRARAGAARAGTARGPWSRAWSRRPAGRGRRASRAGSRTSSCRAAASSAAAPAPRSARGSRPRSRPSWRSRCRPGRRGRRGARRSRSPCASEETMKSVSASSSSVVSLTSRRALESSGLKYSVASAACVALAVELGLEALDDALQVRAGLRVERVEELVEVDRGGRRRRVQRRVVGERPARVRAGRERDVAVRDARQRRQPDHACVPSRSGA